MRRLLVLGLLLAPLGGCTTAWQRARRQDTVDGWRGYLRDASDADDREAARGRIEVLMVRDAEQSRSVRAWRRLLAEFPDGPYSPQARRGLVDARRRAALADGSEAALARFVARHPRAPGADEVRRQLAARRVEALEREPSLAAARALAEDFPDLPEADRARQVAEDLMLQAARAGDGSAAERYLDAFPRGSRRDEAMALLEDTRATAAIGSGDEHALRAFLTDHPTARRRAEVSARLAEVLLARAEATLNPEIAEAAAAVAAPGSDVAIRAGRLSTRLRRGGARLSALRDAIATLAARLSVRPVAALREALASSDALDAWDAVRELAVSDDPAAFDVLLDAAGASNALTATTACVALSGLTARLDLRERATARAQVLQERQANPEDRLRLGALRDALGDADAALMAYEAASSAPTTLLAGSTLAILRAMDAGDPERAQRDAEPLLAEMRARLAALALPDPAEADARAAAAPGAARSLHAMAKLLEQIAARAGAQIDGLPSLGAEVRAARDRAQAEARAHDVRFRSAAEDAVVEAARRQGEERARAAAVLGRSREPAARAALEAARQDPDPAVRAAVEAALRR